MSHDCTAAVASTVMKLLVLLAETFEATEVPALGRLPPFTPLSVHAAAAAETLTVPGTDTWSTNSVRVAFETRLAVIELGSCERSNWTRPCAFEVPPTVIVGEDPKLLELDGTA